MALANDYNSVNGLAGRDHEKSVGIDYTKFESGSIAFDYERMMRRRAILLRRYRRFNRMFM